MNDLKIVNKWNDERENKRSGVFNCPFCNYEDFETFFLGTARYIILAPIQKKRFHFVIMSECPKCFEHSWGHWPSDILIDHAKDEWPKHIFNTLCTSFLDEIKENSEAAELAGIDPLT